MHKLDDLKEMLCDELEEYGAKDKLDVGALDVVDKLAHTIKNLDKIIEGGEYSGNYMDGYERGGRRSYRRDSRGRYSRRYYMAGDIADEIRDLMKDAPDEQTKREMMKLVDHLEKS